MASFLIKFGKSTSKNFQNAVDLASKFDSYKTEEDGKDTIHTVFFRVDQIDQFFELYDIVGKWKYTKVYIDGELLTNFNFLGCYKERTYAYSPTDYCYNKEDGNPYNDNYFGCNFIECNPYSYNGLSGFGTIRKDGTFIVDKNKINHYLMSSARKFGSCPAFDLNKMLDLLVELPDEINPKKHKDWEYITEYAGDNEYAVAVKKIINNQSSYKINNNYQSYESALAKNNSTGCLTLLLLTLAILISPFLIF